VILLTDVLEDINGAFPLFSYGERHIDEFLDENYSFDGDGVKRLWEMYGRLSGNVLEFLRHRFPTLGERSRTACCELQMSQLREKIMRIERGYECYRAIMALYAA